MEKIFDFLSKPFQINEMADTKIEYILRICRLIYEIQQHACLIIYCNLYPDNRPDLNMCVNHWRSEIKGWLKYLVGTKIKNNNTYGARYKIVLREFNAAEFIDGKQEDFIKNLRRVLEKDDHKLVMTDHEWINTFNTLCEIWEPMARMIARGDLEKIDEYIQEYL